ncbi:SIR2 family NAD-dependent protein deacylase [Penaeicola halotolerans]|uniref:SIR2 family NAD-dependent protein deacylase n=1 Tax=Penaeicola halotolerans TaxID=2793196 RepID=UPI001CF83641|nr:NAD-dependent deacylase [Penaeicola halotolerans]
MKKKLVVLSGAGVSAESGIATFRDANGLWEGHDVMQVASPQGWSADPALVLEFYNQRRKQAQTAQPNQAHILLAQLEQQYEVVIITQNVDNLHEKAGSSQVIHLHGELFKSQSTLDPRLVYDMDHWELKLGDRCERGSQLRPYIVWFGEAVPMIEPAIEEVATADIFAVIGTSLLVYPAAGLVQYAPPYIPKFIIDLKVPAVGNIDNLIKINKTASEGVAEMIAHLSDIKD